MVLVHPNAHPDLLCEAVWSSKPQGFSLSSVFVFSLANKFTAVLELSLQIFKLFVYEAIGGAGNGDRVGVFWIKRTADHQ